MKRLPSREELVAFIRERSGKVGVREIARAFGAKNADRAALKRMLRDLADEGRIDRRRKRLHHAGTLPLVVLADVTGRDSDGELLARPTEWDEEVHGAPPVIRIQTPRRPRPDCRTAPRRKSRRAMNASCPKWWRPMHLMDCIARRTHTDTPSARPPWPGRSAIQGKGLIRPRVQ